MTSHGRRKSVGVVETASDLGVSTTTVSRALSASPSSAGRSYIIRPRVIGVNGGNYT